ncbi:MAG: hypothetical protein DSY57_05985 [Desulfobulbus sp.]|nr:MAG: hypothetical protein DSY57_05985 [Desulfobulbus sp.]
MRLASWCGSFVCIFLLTAYGWFRVTQPRFKVKIKQFSMKIEKNSVQKEKNLYSRKLVALMEL